MPRAKPMPTVWIGRDKWGFVMNRRIGDLESEGLSDDAAAMLGLPAALPVGKHDRFRLVAVEPRKRKGKRCSKS